MVANRIVIIGAGQAATSAIVKARREGFEGEITLVGDEDMYPYQRPPLSKKFLLGDLTREQLLLRPTEFYDQANVNFLKGVKAIRLDTTGQSVDLNNGQTIGFDRLLIATGATPRQIEFAKTDTLKRIFTIRTIKDIEMIVTLFQPEKRVLIIGGGYIGLEAAAVARQCGLHTTLVEASPRILQRVAASETSDLFRQLHIENGVTLHEGVSTESITVNADETYRIALSNNTELTVDFVITGIGVVPNIGLAEEARLDVENGIAVDENCRTSHPHIFAAGDCASFPWKGRRVRLESVPNAIEQAEIAVLNMLDKLVPHDPMPWFWSDQYDVKLQIAGLNMGFDQTVARPGSREGGRSIWYYFQDQLIAVDAFNDAPAFMTAKKLLQQGLSPDPLEIANPENNLKGFLC